MKKTKTVAEIITYTILVALLVAAITVTLCASLNVEFANDFESWIRVAFPTFDIVVAGSIAIVVLGAIIAATLALNDEREDQKKNGRKPRKNQNYY